MGKLSMASLYGKHSLVMCVLYNDFYWSTIIKWIDPRMTYKKGGRKNIINEYGRWFEVYHVMSVLLKAESFYTINVLFSHSLSLSLSFSPIAAQFFFDVYIFSASFLVFQIFFFHSSSSLFHLYCIYSPFNNVLWYTATNIVH